MGLRKQIITYKLNQFYRTR